MRYSYVLIRLLASVVVSIPTLSFALNVRASPEYKRYPCIRKLYSQPAIKIINSIRAKSKLGKVTVSSSCKITAKNYTPTPTATPKNISPTASVVVPTIIPTVAPTFTWTALPQATITPIVPVQGASQIAFPDVESGTTQVQLLSLTGTRGSFTVDSSTTTAANIFFLSESELARLAVTPCSNTSANVSCSVGVRYESKENVRLRGNVTVQLKNTRGETQNKIVTLTDNANAKRCALPRYRVWESLFGDGYVNVDAPGTYPTETDGGAGYFDANGQYQNWWIGGWEGPRQEIIESKLRERARLIPGCGVPWVADIEQWRLNEPAFGNTVVETSIAKFRQIFSIMKSERPDISVGLYGVLPESNIYIPAGYQDALNNLSRYNGDTARWQRDYATALANYQNWSTANSRLQWSKDSQGRIDYTAGLSDAVDVIYPSLYVGGDSSVDEVIVRSNILSAKQYGKWIIPFFMMTVPSTGENISLDRWQHLLDYTCSAGADGVLLWGPVTPDWQQKIAMAKAVFNGTKCGS